MEGGKLRNGSFTSASFSNNGYFTHDVWLQGGDLARVVLCWDSNANGSYTTDVLDADLDLAILAGQGTTSGAVLAASSSYDNSYEIVEFCPPSTGWYTIRVSAFASSEFARERMAEPWSPTLSRSVRFSL